MRKSSLLKSRQTGAVPLHSSASSSNASAVPPRAPPPPPSSAPAAAASAAAPCGGGASHEVIYRDPGKNKNPSFDGVVHSDQATAKLFDEESKLLAARPLKKDELLEAGTTIKIGKWEVQVGDATSTSAAVSAPAPQPARHAAAAPAAAAAAAPAAARRPAASFGFRAPSSAAVGAVGRGAGASLSSTSSSAAKVVPTGRAPLPPKPPPKPPKPQAPIPADALVLNRADVAASGARPVVVDRQLARSLRPHQAEGVQFMYDCVMGRSRGGGGGSTTTTSTSTSSSSSSSSEATRPPCGCVLAHSMGLGKSLQAITLIWTLLKSGPTPATERGVIRKALIVCPASLAKNWDKECRRWLPQRLRPTLVPPGVSAAAEAVRTWCTWHQQLMILSYEAVRTHVQQLEAAPIGLLICDEGHRIKSAQGNQTIDALKRLRARRVILTGTPLQNDLTEFWAMCDFVSPNALGSLSEFNSAIATPISIGRLPDATPHQRERAEAAAESMRELSEVFVLRRDASVLASLLPPRTESVVFAHLSSSQADAYRRALRDARTESPLPTITQLRNVCACGSGSPHGQDWHGVAKIAMLVRLLEPVRAAGELVVVCSNFKACLDAVQAALTARGWGSLRLDGDTAVEKRQPLVDRFNSRHTDAFVFLLSTRAGGTGFNLVGANRLVLLDPDWNPANDNQAMGRVYRDGQKRDVHIWRMLATGTVEEKIYQRQLFKRGLNGLVLDQEEKSARAGAAVAEDGDADADEEGGSGWMGMEGGSGRMGMEAEDEAEEQAASGRARASGRGRGRGGGGGMQSGFSPEELRQIFSFDEGATCATIECLLQADPPRLHNLLAGCGADLPTGAVPAGPTPAEGTNGSSAAFNQELAELATFHEVYGAPASHPPLNAVHATVVAAAADGAAGPSISAHPGWIDCLPDPLLRHALSALAREGAAGGGAKRAVSFACTASVLEGLAREARAAEEGGEEEEDESELGPSCEDESEDGDDDDDDEEEEDDDEEGEDHLGAGLGGVEDLELDDDDDFGNDGAHGGKKKKRAAQEPQQKRKRRGRNNTIASDSSDNE